MRLSGIGTRSARLAAKDLVEQGANALISWGSAGGLDPELSPGSLVLPERVLSSEQISYSVDRSWHSRLLTLLSEHVGLHTGPLIESPAVLKTPEEKLYLSKRSGAIAVDMESAAVAKVALKAQIPFVAIRAVLDPVDMRLPTSVLAATDELWRLRPLRLLKGLARHPQEFYLLIQLVRYFRAARATLTSVKHLTGHRLLAP
jgi:adenosylhomocysteine nucleosidase